MEGKTCLTPCTGVYSLTLIELNAVLQQSAAKKSPTAAAITAIASATAAPEEGDFESRTGGRG